MSLVVSIANKMLLNLLQIILGLGISFIILKVPCSFLNTDKKGLKLDIFFIILSSVFGSFMPVELYGLIPVISTLILRGGPVFITAPMIVSNSIFNMLVPYSEASFLWGNSFPRIIFAVLAAAAAGSILRFAGIHAESLFRRDMLEELAAAKSSFAEAIHRIKVYINTLGVYLLTGVIAESIFRTYFYTKVIKLVVTGGLFNIIGNSLLSRNATTNIFFSLAMLLVTVLMDFLRLSGLLGILKFKGIICYWAFFVSLGIVMTSLVFI